MVRVQIPVDTPLDDEDDLNSKRRKGHNENEDDNDDDDEVGIMSDIEESDADDDIADPDWEEVEGGNKNSVGVVGDDDDDDFSFRPGKMASLPENGITISMSRPKRGVKKKDKKRAKKKKNNNNKGRKSGDQGSSNDDEEEDEDEDEEEEESEDEYVVRKRKRTMDVNEMVRKSINRLKITEQLMKHKLSLLLYLARGLRLVKLVNCNVVKGLSLSVVDNNLKFGKARMSNRKFLEMFMERFNELIGISDDDEKRTKHMQQPFMLNLLDCFGSLETTSLIELVVMFVACLKSLKPELPIRIVNVLRPISLRANIIPKPPEGEPMKEPEALEGTQAHEEIIEKLDYWVEVYLADEKKWCCLDLCNGKLDEPNVLTELSRPFRYLVSYDVDRYCVKPAERNYCENWYTPAFRKGRCEDKWWDGVMAALGPSKTNARDAADQTQTDQLLTKQDMPTSDNGFRRHPLYVLEKHLLKFEAIYPEMVPPMGYFKGQPVYPRDCVHTVRSRETWLREARTVRLNETAYKVVKARPKYDKFTGELVRDLPLDLFGEWQTEPYDPPTATDGKVPRNCYGNVDMYKPCMLPKRCVWLKLPGLQRVANKLKIDCAAAVIGFDNHCGSYGAHPVTDGFIVCEEFADTLQAAWEEEQVNASKREEEKRQKRIWDNWKRLLKAAIIRERLRVKYKNS